MASLNGVSLKNLKKMMGTDGIAFSASIYVDGKKMGNVVESGDGGPLNIYGLDGNRDFDALLDARAKAFFAVHPTVLSSIGGKGGDGEDLINEVYHLTETEAYHKKVAKKGFGIVLELGYQTPEDMRNDKIDWREDVMVGVRVWDAKMREKIMKDYDNPKVIRVYQKPEDFEVSV